MDGRLSVDAEVEKKAQKATISQSYEVTQDKLKMV